MRKLVAMVLIGGTVALPAMAQAPNWQQSLQGLVTGNHNQDDALRQAYERGYQHGRDDEARAMRGSQHSESRQYNRDSDRYDRGSDQYDRDNSGPSRSSYR